MTGQQLLDELLRIQKEHPEQLKLDVVHVHTEYTDPEDSCGFDCESDICQVSVVNRQTAYGHKTRDVLLLG